MVPQRCLPFIFVMMAAAAANPAPGRVPKVYNALITSNQNLEPSKAYPLYQPVLQNPYPFSYQTILYNDDPQINGLAPMPYLPAKHPNVPNEAEPNLCLKAPEEVLPAANPVVVPESSSPAPEVGTSTPLPPAPNTESPIPLNEFGLPPQVMPIHGINPSYKYPHLAFPYPYAGVQFYNPYYPLGFNGYPNYQFYPQPNVLQHPLQNQAITPEAPTIAPVSHIGDTDPQTSSSNELNALNYPSKDPAIPNVPPPPLPEGGLKTNKE